MFTIIEVFLMDSFPMNTNQTILLKTTTSSSLVCWKYTLRKAHLSILSTIVGCLCLPLFLTACSGGGDDKDNAANACEIVGLSGGKIAKVINGETCARIQTAAIVRIAAFVETSEGTVPVPVCTGTAISANKVLTAAHCVSISEIEGNRISGFGIITGEAGEVSVKQARSSSTPPGLNSINGQLVQDAALLIFDQPLGLATLPLLTSQPPGIGETGYVYGYGKRNEGTTIGEGDDFFTLEAGAMTIESVNADYVTVLFDGRGTNVCNGDSGGPLIVLRNGTPGIVGIVSQGTVEGCRAGDNTFFTNIQNSGVESWLAATATDAARQ
jgi:trypsin